jgi:hypothetical protein
MSTKTNKRQRDDPSADATDDNDKDKHEKRPKVTVVTKKTDDQIVTVETKISAENPPPWFIPETGRSEENEKLVSYDTPLSKSTSETSTPTSTDASSSSSTKSSKIALKSLPSSKTSILHFIEPPSTLTGTTKDNETVDHNDPKGSAITVNTEHKEDKEHKEHKEHKDLKVDKNGQDDRKREKYTSENKVEEEQRPGISSLSSHKGRPLAQNSRLVPKRRNDHTGEINNTTPTNKRKLSTETMKFHKVMHLILDTHKSFSEPLEGISRVRSEGAIHINEVGMKITFVDEGQVMIVRLHLLHTYFRQYHVPEHGLKFGIVFKTAIDTFKGFNKPHQLNIYSEDDKLKLNFKREADSKYEDPENVTIKFPLNDIEDDNSSQMKISAVNRSIAADMMIDIPSSKFHEWVGTNSKQASDTLDFESDVKEKKFRLSYEGEIQYIKEFDLIPYDEFPKPEDVNPTSTRTYITALVSYKWTFRLLYMKHISMSRKVASRLRLYFVAEMTLPLLALYTLRSNHANFHTSSNENDRDNEEWQDYKDRSSSYSSSTSTSTPTTATSTPTSTPTPISSKQQSSISSFMKKTVPTVASTASSNTGDKVKSVPTNKNGKKNNQTSTSTSTIVIKTPVNKTPRTIQEIIVQNQKHMQEYLQKESTLYFFVAPKTQEDHSEE